jgi:hypothetical protein
MTSRKCVVQNLPFIVYLFLARAACPIVRILEMHALTKASENFSKIYWGKVKTSQPINW